MIILTVNNSGVNTDCAWFSTPPRQGDWPQIHNLVPVWLDLPPRDRHLCLCQLRPLVFLADKTLALLLEDCIGEPVCMLPFLLLAAVLDLALSVRVTSACRASSPHDC